MAYILCNLRWFCSLCISSFYFFVLSSTKEILSQVVKEIWEIEVAKTLAFETLIGSIKQFFWKSMLLLFTC